MTFITSFEEWYDKLSEEFIDNINLTGKTINSAYEEFVAEMQDLADNNFKEEKLGEF